MRNHRIRWTSCRPFLVAAALGGVFVYSSLSGCNPSDGGADLGSSDAVPTGPCHDGMRDQNETDVDCGGVCGPTCKAGQHCDTDKDCNASLCDSGTCTPPGSTCFNHVRDGEETDVDCGGLCPRCDDGKNCKVNLDCDSGDCEGGVCAVGKPAFAFAAARFGSAGYEPSAMVVADFDGDGKLDAATANHMSESAMVKTKDVTVMLGNGDGTMQDPISAPVGGDPDALVVGDWNGDGKPDLAAANQDMSTITILMNAGHGNLSALPDFATGGSPWSLTTADVNSDGKLDLFVAAQNTGDIDIHLGRGDGTFEAPIKVSAGTTATGITVGDWNGDHLLDMAAISDQYLQIFLGTPTGFSMPSAVGSVDYPWFLGATDVNGDGRPDLVTSTYQGFLHVLLGNGDGSFGVPSTYSLGGSPWIVVEADFDSDGKLDLATGNTSSDTIQILRGNGDGSFEPAQNFFVGGSIQWIAAADMNGDHKPDIVLCDYFTHDVGVMLNQSGL